MASTVVTHIIIFIAVLGIASGLLVAMKNYADETEGAFNTQSQKYNQVIKTSINIDVVHYDNTTNVTHVYVTNTGMTVIKPDEVNLYIDGVRAPSNESNATVEPDTEILNTGKWDPKELLHFSYKVDLNDTITHEVIVVTPYTVQDRDSFSI